MSKEEQVYKPTPIYVSGFPKGKEDYIAELEKCEFPDGSKRFNVKKFYQYDEGRALTKLELADNVFKNIRRSDWIIMLHEWYDNERSVVEYLYAKEHLTWVFEPDVTLSFENSVKQFVDTNIVMQAYAYGS